MTFNGKPKDTDDLKSELMESADLDAFLSENEENFNDANVQELLNSLYLKTDLSKAELARRSGVSTVYLHQLFSGRRNPSRDKLICLMIGLGATLDDTQELLRRSGFAELYAKDKRDAIIIFAFEHGLSRVECDDELYRLGEKTLLPEE